MSALQNIVNILYFGALHNMTSRDLRPVNTLFANSEQQKILHPGRGQYVQVFVKFFKSNSLSKFENFVTKLNSLVENNAEKSVLSP